MDITVRLLGDHDYFNRVCRTGRSWYKDASNIHSWGLRGCIQKFPDWPPGARTENDTVLCHKVRLYPYSV